MSKAKINVKGLLIIVAAIPILFAVIEIYGIAVGGDWSVVVPTVLWQVVAITVIVTPMIYGMLFDSDPHEE